MTPPDEQDTFEKSARFAYIDRKPSFTACNLGNRNGYLNPYVVALRTLLLLTASIVTPERDLCVAKGLEKTSGIRNQIPQSLISSATQDHTARVRV
jgi:hypothetical protein